MTAGLAMMRELEKPSFYEGINACAERIRKGISSLAKDAGFAVQITGVGSMFTVHFSECPLRNVRDVLSSDRETAGAFYLGLVVNGVHILENHVGFTSGAHTDSDVEKILSAAKTVFDVLKSKR